MPDLTLKTIYDEMRQTHEALTQSIDKRFAEIVTHGHERSDTAEEIKRIETDLTELRKQYDQMVAASKRPSGDMGGAAGDDGKAKAEFQKRAFVKFLRYGLGETGRALFTPEEHRALSSASDVDGGYLVPPEFANTILMNAYNLAAIRPLANPMRTGRDSVTLPALAKPSVAWGRRTLAVTAQELSAGAERIEIFDQKALVLISNNTLDDAEADVLGEIQSKFSPALAESEDDAFAVGVGDDSPQGIITHADVLANYTATGVADAISDASHNGIDALIDLMASIKTTYRRNAVWLMNSLTEAAVRKLKDDYGQYLWQPPVQAGMPATLLGRPVAIPEGMPDIAANAYPIAFGDLRNGYDIRDRAGLSVQRLVEKYAEYDQTGFLVKRRVGGQVVLPEAFGVLKVAAS